MARIPEEELARLKREVSLAKLAQDKGIELRRVGKDLVGRCPFHEGDSEPSFHISEDKDPPLWHCFGCGLGGSCLDFVIKTEQVSVRHAIELLRSRAGSSPTGVRPQDGQGGLLDPEASDQELLRQVVRFYHQNLKPEALSYLRKRGLLDRPMLEHFLVGYADRSLGYKLTRGTHTRIRRRLKQLGVLRSETGHEHFSGSLVVPILGEGGEVLGIYGRKIHDDLRSGTPKHLYLPGPHRGMWNGPALRGQAEILICEAILDAMSFYAAGFHNVTAAYGTQGCTPEIFELLKHSGARVLIAYDSDETGSNAAMKLAEQLLEQGIECYRVEVPSPCKDVNEYAVAHGQEARSVLSRLIEQARPIGQSPPRSVAEPLRARAEAQASSSVREQQLAALAARKGVHPAEPAGPGASAQGLQAAQMPAAQAQEADAAEPEAPSLAAVAAPLEMLRSDGDKAELRLGPRSWTVRGLDKLTGLEQLRLAVQCRMGDAYHLDSVDFYNARSRSGFLRQAAEELAVPESVLKAELGRLLGAVEELVERRLGAALSPKASAPQLSDTEREEALALLRDPHLLERLLSDFERAGLIGESTNKLLLYLACTSRKLPRPLSVLVQSNSAAGKSSLVEGVLSFMPSEDAVQYSALTGQALYYLEGQSLEHKILSIAEEEGAQKAVYPLKQLLSEGKLSIASTGKDPLTGKQVAHEYSVRGRPALLSTSTAAEMDEELANRCVVLSVDEGREQTRAIHQQQRRSRGLDGLWAVEIRDELLKLHQNAQRLLEPLHVVNPYAEDLTFLDDRTRMRRDHPKYLSLIESIALLMQYQRPVRASSFRGQVKQYVEVKPSDIELANRLMNEALGRSLDELAPQTRRLLLLTERLVAERARALGCPAEEVRVRAKEIRAFSGWSATQVKLHIHKLCELEYLLAHRAPRGQSFLYELLYDGQGKDGRPFVPGLLDPAKLTGAEGLESDPHRPDGWSEKSASRPYGGPIEARPGNGPVRDAPGAESIGPEEAKEGQIAKNRLLEEAIPNSKEIVEAGRNGSHPGGGPS